MTIPAMLRLLTPHSFASARRAREGGWVLGPSYEATWLIAQNYFTEFKFNIEAAVRPKMYFARRDSIKEMKRIIRESDEFVREGTFPWNTTQGLSFIESLPDLR
jgi:hypothetical protein